MLAGSDAGFEESANTSIRHSGESFEFALPLDGASSSGGVVIPDAHLLFSGDFKRSQFDLILFDQDRHFVARDYLKGEKHPTLFAPDGASLSGDAIDALTGHVNLAKAGTGTSPAIVIGTVVKPAARRQSATASLSNQA